MYRSRLNARLWLDCRLKMCQALASQVKGLGKVEQRLPYLKICGALQAH